MQAGLVSVVVPVYKTEKYLDRCINSIVNQTYRNLEILLIDDGSPDKCPQMCDEWALKDSRIRVIHKPNAGLGMARNTGIENARGEYVCFFDSDDYVDTSAIERAYALGQRESADIVVFGFVISNMDGEAVAYQIPRPLKHIYCGEDVRRLFLPDLIGVDPRTGNATNLYMSACVCLISMEMIKRANWRFSSEKEIIAEDVFSLLGLYKYVNKVAVLEEAFYHYCENQDSLTHTYRADRFEKIKHFYRESVRLCHDSAYPPEVERRCMEPFLSFTISALKQEAVYSSRKKDAIMRIREIVDDELLQHVLMKKKHDKTGIRRRILFWAIRHKQYHLCYLLLTVQNSSRRK